MNAPDAGDWSTRLPLKTRPPSGLSLYQRWWIILGTKNALISLVRGGRGNVIDRHVEMISLYCIVPKDTFTLCDLRLRFVLAFYGVYRGWWFCRNRIVLTLKAQSHVAFFSDCDCDSSYRNKWAVQDSMEVFTVCDCDNITNSHVVHYK